MKANIGRMKLNTYDFAMMLKFAELGKSYGLEPWEYCIEYDTSCGETRVSSEPAAPEAYKRFDAMMKALGVDGDDIRAIPYEQGPEMSMALDKAIQNAPRKWAR